MGQPGRSDLPKKVCKIGHGTVNARERVGATRELAKDHAHEMASIRVHFRRQARNADPWRGGGASRGREF